MKKTISLLLALVMVLGILAGCQNDQPKQTDPAETKPHAGNNDPKPTDPQPTEYHYKNDVTYVLSGPQGSTDDWAGTTLVQWFKETYGITLECEPYPDDAWSTKLNLMLAEDDLPDIVVRPSLSMTEVNSYGMEEYFLAIDEYLEHMPNYAKFLEEHPDYKLASTAPDGHIYGIIRYNMNKFDLIPRNWINTQWIENVGLEYPTNVDELYEVLKAFKEQDANGNGDPNDEIPMSWSSYSRNPLHTIMVAFGIIPESNTGNPSYQWQYKEDGTVVLAETTEEWKAFLAYLNKLWSEGLIWDQAFTADVNAQRTLTKAGQIGIWSDASTAVGTGDNGVALQYKLFAGLTSQYNTTPQYMTGYAVVSTPQAVISATVENPAEILRALDTFFDTEINEYGLSNADIPQQGMYWTKETFAPESADSVVEGFEDFIAWGVDPNAVPAGYDSWEVYRHKKMTINDTFRFLVTMAPVYQAVENGPQDLLVNYYDPAKCPDGLPYGNAWIAGQQLVINDYNLERVYGAPPVNIPAEYADEFGVLNTDLSTYCNSSFAKFVTGEWNLDSDWDAFQQQLEKVGVKRMTEIKQEAYTNYLGN